VVPYAGTTIGDEEAPPPFIASTAEFLMVCMTCAVLVLLYVLTENRWRCVRCWGRRLDGVVDLYTRESAWKLSGHTVG
jgi:hypothetical protein